MKETSLRVLRKYGISALDFLLVFFLTAVLVRPLFRAKYLQLWPSIESTFIADARFLAAHWPHPLWQPLWYCGTRFDYIYPPLLRYGTALLTNIFIPVKAYHVFTALMFCFGIAGVYFMVRVMAGSRLQAWVSAVGCALISPSFLFIRAVREDAPYLLSQRLGAMVRYGEGPHISSLSLLPYALAFAFLAIGRRRPLALVFAGIFSALVVLTNFYGATALAILYPVLVWSLWTTHRNRAVWVRALAIPALACALSAFWLTPSYFRITLYNLRYVSQPGNQHSVLLLLAAVAVYVAASIRWTRGRPELAFLVFVAGSLLFMALNVLGHYYINFRIIGEPGRLIPELDMVIILFTADVLRRLWTARFPAPPARWAARLAVVAVALCAAWPVHIFLPHAWDLYPKEPDYRARVEYRMSDWTATHLPDSRTFVTGSVRFWWDAWQDNAEVAGGSDQGLMNPNPMSAAWDILLGSDPGTAILWLQSLGADAIIVSDERSQNAYRDYRSPHKFVGAMPVLFDDNQGNVIYRVPRRYPGLARVVDRAQLAAAQPFSAGNLPLLRAYASLVEQGPAVPASTHWNGTDSISVHTSVDRGQSVLVQVTYDPAWHAYSGGKELPIHADAMDFIAVDAPPGTRDMTLVFEMPLENRLGYTATILALLLCILICIVECRKLANSPLSGEPRTNQPFHPQHTVR